VTTEKLETIADNSEATNAELAKSEDITAYVEERHQQEAEDRPQKDDDGVAETVKDLREKHGLTDKKKASRYERLKQSRDAAQAEAAELRAQLGARDQTPEVSGEGEPAKFDAQALDGGAIENSLRFAADKHGEKFKQAYDGFIEYLTQTRDQATYNKVMSAPDIGDALVEWYEQGGHIQGAIEHGRQSQEFDQALAARDEQIRVTTECKLRAENFASKFPDYYETLQSIQGVYEIPPLMLEMMVRSPHGPAMIYMLAKDAYADNSSDALAQLEQIAHDPIALARQFGKLEQVVESAMQNRGGGQQRTATKAPPPIRPIQGGSDGPKDLHTLAKSDSIEAYVAARRRNA
jgi:hypothetical protein